MPLVVDATDTIVSLAHGRVRAASVNPPQRSTTGRPSTYPHTPAPTSPCLVKFSANAACTAAKRGSQRPWGSAVVVMIVPRLPGRPATSTQHSPADRIVELPQVAKARPVQGHGPGPLTADARMRS